MSTATQNQPKIYTAHAWGEWTGGVRSEITIRHFEPIVMDEPESLGGNDTGPNPMEYLLGALIGCKTVVFALVAKEHGFTYSDLKFDLKGSLDVRGLEGVEGVRPYFKSIQGTIQVTTTEDQTLSFKSLGKPNGAARFTRRWMQPMSLLISIGKSYSPKSGNISREIGSSTFPGRRMLLPIRRPDLFGCNGQASVLREGSASSMAS